MPGRGRTQKYEDGRSFSNGKAWNGTDQEVIKYLSYIKRSLPRTWEGSGTTFCYVEYKCSQAKPSSAGWWSRIKLIEL